MDRADRTALNEFDHAMVIRGRVNLRTHLGHDASFCRSLRDSPRFVDVVSQRLFVIHVLAKLQLSYFGSNSFKKGTIIVATGYVTFSPGAGNRKGHEWYTLHVEKWQKFRIVKTDRNQ